ncbi:MULTISPECIES: DUF2808 domain-containing protein [unclassified Coleofasciculus]|uniref:DUF2808 domain-containing protein n=1 Tax=unclassified Coleofasciculus TaxID=2692782 RepID=UPI0018816E78|nr:MULTISPECIES: DUF2808 domain-containing protein [unclassified Coleofasciculus]MBE9126109.1 DUF2808 domain-containing protein [Coleofasciculus sp. LEGE 07081]MBE9147536.1 DUF2808 domain-containing protein [Coleofasciculus sp. LEGE 07092]
MRISTLFALTLSAASISGVVVPPAPAIQQLNGTVSFEKSPRLIDVFSTFDSVGVWGAKYYFTIELPEDAGEPLQQVTISQRQGGEEIRFRLHETRSFTGTPSDKGERLALQAVTRDEETDTISVVFEEPISPGQTFTIGLVPVRNPYFGGVYLFGVTAFPAGEKPYGLYLGPGRLHFYRRACRFGAC